VQNRYNLGDRSHDAVLDACTREKLAFLPWYPLGAGTLAGPHRVLGDIAGRHRATPAQVALAWLLRRSPVVLPIPGTASIEHFEENLAAAQLQLTADEFRALSEARL